MTYGDKERLKALKARSASAAAIGHAVLDTGPDTRRRICALTLRDLKVRHSRLDLFLAMFAEQIAPESVIAAEFEAVVSGDLERRDRQADGARRAREKAKRARQREEAIETYLATTTAGNQRKDAGHEETSAPLPDGGDSE